MARTTAIASTVAAADADVTVGAGESITVWTSQLLEGGESVSVYLTDGASEEVRVSEEEAGTAKVYAKNTCVALNGPAIFRLKKTETAAAVAVYYES